MEKEFSEFWIGSFDIDNEIHMDIFNELMERKFEKEIDSEDLFKGLDIKYYELYFEKKKQKPLINIRRPAK